MTAGTERSCGAPRAPGMNSGAKLQFPPEPPKMPRGGSVTEYRMRVREWLRDVLWSGQLQRWWFSVSVLVTIGTLLIRHLPAWVRYVPPSVIVIGLFVSNLAAYSRVRTRIDDLEARLSGVAVDLVGVYAGEHVYPFETPHSGPPHHSLVVEFQLALRNRDGQAPTTVQLSGCTVDVPDAKLESLRFAGDPNTTEQAGEYRTVGAGTTRGVVVSAVFELPLSQTHIGAECVCGTLSLRDTRDSSYGKEYSTELVKNPVGGR